MHYFEGIIDLQLVNSSDPAMVVLNSSDTSPGVYITNPHNFSVTVLALARRYRQKNYTAEGSYLDDHITRFIIFLYRG